MKVTKKNLSLLFLLFLLLAVVYFLLSPILYETLFASSCPQSDQEACFMSFRFVCRRFNSDCEVPPMWVEKAGESAAKVQGLPKDCQEELEGKTDRCPPERLIVSFKEGVTEAEMKAVMDQYKLTPRQQFKTISYRVYTNPGGYQTYCDLKKEPVVESVEIDCLYSIQ